MKTATIETIYNESTKCDTYSVYCYKSFTGRYMKKEDAELKVFNFLTNYEYAEKENQVKNAMFKSSNNSHNSIV